MNITVNIDSSRMVNTAKAESIPLALRQAQDNTVSQEAVFTIGDTLQRWVLF